MSPETIAAIEQQAPWLMTLGGIATLAIAAWITNSVVKRLILYGINKALASTAYGRDPELTRHGFIERLANIMPALVIMWGVRLVPDLTQETIKIVYNISTAFIVLTLALALSALLNIINVIYLRRHHKHAISIKGYIQLMKLVIALVTVIMVIAILMDRSPLVLLSGVGALAAVLMLIFQDTLLSLVASVQISSSDMLRLGDWIEIPQLNADGAVVDIALHTVKVQNWDKTITTIPTRKLITDPFKNWRGMQESGGRRIKRSIYLDQESIHFLSAEEKAGLRHFRLLADYLDQKEQDMGKWNGKLEGEANHPVNMRRITNIGTFRIYADKYLRTNPYIRQDMALMVRQLSPTPKGLPLEIYCFTNTVIWAEYENIQADIFDHLLAILPEFGLKVMQVVAVSD